VNVALIVANSSSTSPVVLYPNSKVVTLVIVWLTRIPAWFFLGVRFFHQLDVTAHRREPRDR
jgi:hypothetical protein